MLRALLALAPALMRADLIITELSDPSNVNGAAYDPSYVELYSPLGQQFTCVPGGQQFTCPGGTVTPDDWTGCGWHLVLWSCGSGVNGCQPGYASQAAQVHFLSLWGESICPGQFMIVCANKADFESTYPGRVCDIERPAAIPNAIDAAVAIIDTSSTRIDVFGVPDGNGFAVDASYTGERRARKAGVTASKATWSAADWEITTSMAAPGSFDPRAWEGVDAPPPPPSTPPLTPPPPVVSVSLVITELADPNTCATCSGGKGYNGRFVELYSPLGVPSLTGLRLVTYSGSNLAFYINSELALSGAMAAGAFLIVCRDKSSFDTAYAPKVCDIGLRDAADNSGHSQTAIIDAAGTIIDIFGVVVRRWVSFESPESPFA